jgi:hypothetical protein
MYFVAIWYILWLFGIFFPFWYVMYLYLEKSGNTGSKLWLLIRQISHHR